MGGHNYEPVAIRRAREFPKSYTFGDLQIEAVTKIVPNVRGTSDDPSTVRQSPLSLPRVRWLEREVPEWMTK